MEDRMIAVGQLRGQIKGRVIEARDPEYDDARKVFVGGVDRRPALIVRVVDSSDVAAVIAFARETGLDLAVRSGGHSWSGDCVADGGIVIDLRDMRAVTIDDAGRTAWAETGLTARDYSLATHQRGMATGFGDTGSVGIGGLTLGGGVGYLVRKHGLTIDNLLAAEIVTADGQLLRPDAETHPDLFWALRGGGGDFGVATRFQFRPHQVSTIVEQLRATSAPLAVARLRVLGGAMARLSADATAFAHRGRPIMAALGAVWERGEEAAPHKAWVSGFAAALRQGGPGVYVNFVG